MQDPRDPQGPPPAQGRPLNQNPPRRQRQERTVYTRSQQEQLEAYFQEKQYPNFDERLELAQKLDLREQQLQVWFKNRRAKLARERRLQKQPQSGPGPRGRGARAAPPDPAGAASAPGGPEFPQGWDSWMSPQPGPSGILPAAKPTTYSLHHAWGGPGRGAQGGFLAGPGPGPCPIPAPLPGPAQVPGPHPGPTSGPFSGSMLGPASNPGPVPGPVSGPGPIPDPVRGGCLMPPGPASLPAPAPDSMWPQSPYASSFWPDTQLFSDLPELLAPLDAFEDSSVSTQMSQYEEKDGSVDENPSLPRGFLDL
ncbi:tetra-peptide repeat homeobox protein 1-like [Cebus imitator]|uniref:tetra-peptide repeat homeobox protein 1-like n=1 Tax=Cebus imitator TaxID=2715852 RepID=UPI000809F608|nr:tetra-peptide repeat homeobox protein 1-like [Cebus imitator]